MNKTSSRLSAFKYNAQKSNVAAFGKKPQTRFQSMRSTIRAQGITSLSFLKASFEGSVSIRV